ncbi:MAG: hypothetical protein ACR2QO_20665 [Acidimicrobiales bacterium]
MADRREAGRQLAKQHEESAVDAAAGAGTSAPLVHYAESTRKGDWSLRSALVRLAQPEPVRAGAVLELVRRCDASLSPFGSRLENERISDLARIQQHDDERFAELLEGYEAESPLSDEEIAALPYLGVAVTLEELAVVLSDWAGAGAPDPPPRETVDALCATAFEQLESLGAPREEQPGPPGRRGRA